MSAIATSGPLHRAIRFYEATIGKKVVMAATGVILFGYVLGHMLGNLQIFIGRDQINNYAEFLHTHDMALWGVRVFLLAALVMHIVASFQLWALNRAARPVSYYKKDDVPAAYAARTMKWSGPIIAAFVVFHVLHLTTGDVMPLKHVGNTHFFDVYENVIDGFRNWPVALAYIVAVSLLGTHLYHGLWSMFQSMGLSHPRYTPLMKRFATIFAVVVTLGFIAVPAAVLAGVLTY